MTNERLQALEILIACFDKEQTLTSLLQSQDLPPFVKALCFGVARYYPRLALLAESCLEKRPKDIHIWLIILLGLYQIHEMGLPDYAVVQESVALLESLKKTWAKGFINAVLRRYCRERETLENNLSSNPIYQYTHPFWLIEKIKAQWPNDWSTILDANNQHPPLSIRINQRHQSIDSYIQLLNEKNIHHHRIPFTESGVILENPCGVQDIPGFHSGDCSVQDGAAQLAGLLLNLKPGQRILDACCAPGGKLGHILELESQLQVCVGLDIDIKRLRRVQENCQRLQIEATLLTGDAAIPQDWWDNIPFDRILLDAPCSATGIIRRQPDIRVLRTADDIRHIVKVQTQILEALWPLLKSGGILIYATCSIMAEENERQIAKFIQSHEDAIVRDSTQAWGRFTGHGWQILPGDHEMDGFFYALIEKKSMI